MMIESTDYTSNPCDRILPLMLQNQIPVSNRRVLNFQLYITGGAFFSGAEMCVVNGFLTVTIRVGGIRSYHFYWSTTNLSAMYYYGYIIGKRQKNRMKVG